MPALVMCPCRDLLEQLVDRGDLRIQSAKVCEHVPQRSVGEWIGQAPRGDPSTVAQRPRLALTVDVSVAQERCDAVAGRGARAAKIITTGHEVAQALLHRRWRRR